MQRNYSPTATVNWGRKWLDFLLKNRFCVMNCALMSLWTERPNMEPWFSRVLAGHFAFSRFLRAVWHSASRQTPICRVCFLRDSPLSLFNLPLNIQPLFKAVFCCCCRRQCCLLLLFTSSSRRKILGKITVFSARGEMKHSVRVAISIVPQRFYLQIKCTINER